MCLRCVCLVLSEYKVWYHLFVHCEVATCHFNRQFGVVTLGLLTHHLFCHLFEFPEPEGQGILNSKGYSVVETLNMSRTALWDREVHLMLAYLFGLHFLSNVNRDWHTFFSLR